MEKYEIIAARPCHIAPVAERMRAADRAEVWASAHLSPGDALRISLQDSILSWTGLVDGNPVCLFGVAPASLLSGTGIPWLLATDAIEAHARAFLRRNKVMLGHMQARFSRLENWVDTRNMVSRRWLNWLGFHCEEAVPHGVSGLLFHRFWMEDVDV